MDGFRGDGAITTGEGRTWLMHNCVGLRVLGQKRRLPGGVHSERGAPCVPYHARNGRLPRMSEDRGVAWIGLVLGGHRIGRGRCWWGRVAGVGVRRHVPLRVR